ncbi:hypothetical protein AB1Y20_000016 [Prymnesium parvum]|uniref:Protein O-GlcNAc transferase n=1 Tax=Prymnesium parvum TaxID=97485 RepID=A0AB34K3F8_PRYPA
MAAHVLLLLLLLLPPAVHTFEVLPKDADGWCALGRSLASQQREAEAVRAFEAALSLDSTHFESLSALAAAHGALGEYEAEKRAYLAALELRPDHAPTHLGLGVSYASLEAFDAAEAALLAAAAADEEDARASLQLGRLLTQLSRPAEAVHHFYAASARDGLRFGEVAAAVGTARGLQARLAQAAASFEAALRVHPQNEKLARAASGMRRRAALLAASGAEDAVAEVCGAGCQQLLDAHGLRICAVSWRDGCGDEPPPPGFTPESTVAQLCARACAATRLAVLPDEPTDAPQDTAAAAAAAAASSGLFPPASSTAEAARSGAVERNWTQGYVQTAAANVILQCQREQRPLADSAPLASAPPTCSWEEYESFLAAAGLDWLDDPAAKASAGGTAQLSSYASTATTIAEALRLLLGNEAYATRTEAVTIDVIGWAFTWRERPEAEETSMTDVVHAWDAQLQAETRLVWGMHVGDALRRLLPRVEAVLVRGFGPEAPSVDVTPLRQDGWLSLELRPGLYETASEPAPTLTLLENSGLHDGGVWPSDADCLSDKGCVCTTRGCVANRSLAVKEQLQLVEADDERVWSRRGVPLSCYWRQTIELLVGTGRPVLATSYQSHEHLLAIHNLRALGARITHAFPNGLGEIPQMAEMDLLLPPGPLAEAMRDPYPRAWGYLEATYASTNAMWWRYRIEVEGYERYIRGARNSHVILFQGAEGGTAEDRTAASLQKRMQQQACKTAELPATPPRQAAIIRDVWRCAQPFA